MTEEGAKEETGGGKDRAEGGGARARGLKTTEGLTDYLSLFLDLYGNFTLTKPCIKR